MVILHRLMVGCLRQPASLVLFVAALGLLPSQAVAQFEMSQHFSKEEQLGQMEATVRITNNLGKGKNSQGSGVCIGQDKEGNCYVLTCAHVMKGGKGAFTIETFTAKSYPNPVKKYEVTGSYWEDEDWDLVLIKVNANIPRSCPIAPISTVLTEGQPVASIGCGIGSPPSVQVGKMIDKDERQDLVFNRGAVGGRSGGPLIARQGLVGILARTSDEITYAVHHEKICRFIKGCKQDWLLRE